VSAAACVGCAEWTPQSACNSAAEQREPGNCAGRTVPVNRAAPKICDCLTRNDTVPGHYNACALARGLRACSYIVTDPLRSDMEDACIAPMLAGFASVGIELDAVPVARESDET